VNFMLVGHTHDDIDALFGRWSMLLKKDKFPTIPLLMKSFMEVESIPTIPHLIEEVPDFKGFIVGCIAQGDEALEGHTKAQWPRKEPAPLSRQPMKNLEEILRGISGFMKYWEKLSNEDSTREYQRHYEHLWYYWYAVKDALVLSIQPLSSLRDGFWLVSWIASAPEDEFIEDGNVRKECNEDDHFVGQRWDSPAPSYLVLRDVYEGYFVAVWPADGDSRLVWIAQAKSNPNYNLEWPNYVLIQYFQPTSRSQLV
jgi:hypothetical protein